MILSIVQETQYLILVALIEFSGELYIDSDFLVPTLLLKVRHCPLPDCAFLTRLLMPQYYCFLFAGTTWISAAVGDMLQVLFFTIATF